MVVRCTLIALSTGPAVGALLGGRYSDLLDLVAVGAASGWATGACHLDLLSCVAGRS